MQARVQVNALRHCAELVMTSAETDDLIDLLTKILGDNGLDGYKEVGDARSSLDRVRLTLALLRSTLCKTI